MPRNTTNPGDGWATGTVSPANSAATTIFSGTREGAKVIHRGAEIRLLRDLYLHRSD